jgi:uncharacterized protein YdhG (YjbR/CyaY superfamily)
MVQSKAATVDAYIAELPPDRAPYLHRLREIAQKVLPDGVEEMRYGMPTYSRGGRAEFAFASQKQYVSLYVKPDAHAKNAEALAGLDTGKGCIRFRRPAGRKAPPRQRGERG